MTTEATEFSERRTAEDRRGLRPVAAALGLLAAASGVAAATLLGALDVPPAMAVAALTVATGAGVAAVVWQSLVLVRPALARAADAERALFAERALQRRRTAADRRAQDGAAAQLAEARRARAAAEARASEKSEFLARISEEVRTPLTGIFGMAELMTETDLDDEQAAMIDTIRQSADQLARVIEAVMDYSRIEGGDLALKVAPFDLREAAERALAQVVPTARKKGLELVLDVPTLLPTGARGDADRLKQILAAILENAVKFTERGNVVLRITMAQKGSTQLTVFEVIDTGCGIPKDTIATIFDPFSRAAGSGDRHYGGTGLGLTIAARLAEAMGGRIDVRSVERRGSTFTLQLPLDVDRGRDSRTVPVDLTGCRFLVVDDNTASRAVVLRRLGEWGGEGIGAAGVEDVDDLLWSDGAGPPPADLILLDSTLADGDAWALARRLTDSLPTLPLIMLDALGTATAADGMVSSVLEKPIRTGALAAAVRSALDGGDAEGVRRRSVPRPARLEPACIVLADDNATNRTLIEKFLAGEPMTLIHASDGVGAIEAYRDWAPDLILMDVSMPNMDGLEATRRIRAMEVSDGGRVHVPIIALTARAMEQDRERCLAAGMDDHVAKPVRKADLHAKIAEWTMERRHSA